MAKKAQAKPATEAAQEGPGDAQLEADPPATKGDPDPTAARITLSTAVGLAGSDDAGFAGLPANLGELPPQPSEPTIPPELDAELSPRERRIVWRMVNGATYERAYSDTAPRGGTSKPNSEIPRAVVAAVSACLRQIAVNAGTSRTWIIQQTMALLARAAQAEPVLDRKGRPTGEYRFDGATATKCLAMLAEWCPELGAKRGPGFAAGEVAELMLAVAARGRGAIADSGRLVGSSSAAQQQQAKA